MSTARAASPPQPAAPDGPAPVLVHLGCGRIAPQGWINIDGSWNARLGRSTLLRRALRLARLMPADTAATTWPANIRVRDLRRPLPFADGSADAVFSSHLIEHLYRDEAVRLLREAFRVLRPGGVCRTVVPDLGFLVERYAEQRAEPADARDWPDPARELNANLRLRKERPWGGSLPVRVYRAMYDFRSHKQMYDAESLGKLMEEAGFVGCRRRDLHDSAIPSVELVEPPDRVLDGGLAVEGVKPGA